MKKIVMTTLLITVGLTACTPHENPLSKMIDTDAARFLVKADRYAEKELKINGYLKTYLNCMEGKEVGTTCNNVYREMLTYAKSQPGFQSLTEADLTNEKVWQTLKYTYLNTVFNRLSDDEI